MLVRCGWLRVLNSRSGSKARHAHFHKDVSFSSRLGHTKHSPDRDKARATNQVFQERVSARKCRHRAEINEPVADLEGFRELLQAVRSAILEKPRNIKRLIFLRRIAVA
jgi:hypothetical protein